MKLFEKKIRKIERIFTICHFSLYWVRFSFKDWKKSKLPYKKILIFLFDSEPKSRMYYRGFFTKLFLEPTVP